MQTSIIMCVFDFTRTLRHMTMACIANLRRFTDDDDYELIIVDNEIKWPIRDDQHVLHLEKVKIISNEKDVGYYASLNQGAKEAKGKYLCFLQPDVFVHEGWLKNMTYYLDNGLAEAAFPDQWPQTREHIKSTYTMSYDEATKYGGREAGCLLITRAAFDRTGGWDDRLFNEYGEAAFYNRMGKANVKWVAAGKSLVTHVTAGTRYTMWDLHPEVHLADMDKDSAKWGEIRNET